MPGMAGDVNLFWNDLEETTTAEIEVSCRTLQTVLRTLRQEFSWLLRAIQAAVVQAQPASRMHCSARR